MKRYLAMFILAILLIMANGNAVFAGPELQGGGSIYYVTWGDTLSSIALRHGVSVEAILRQNGLTNPEMIYVGQPLAIPGRPYDRPTNYGVSGCANYHTVRVGDTLSDIAWDYNIPLQDLLRQNKLYNKDVLFVGQRICVPAWPGYAPQDAGYQRANPSPTSSHYHTVASGETLNGIALHYGVNQRNIVQSNSLRNPAYIWAGQQLLIPDYRPEPRYSAPAPAYGQAAGESIPPVVPPHTGAFDDAYADPPPYEEPDDPGPDIHIISEPPDFEPAPVHPLLPRAEHPLEVVVNGGETWADQVHGMPDPDGITTLIVKTGEESGRLVRARSGDAEIKGESDYPAFFNAEFGPFRFVVRHIAPGNYDVWIDDPDTPSEVTQVEIEAGEREEIIFEKQVRFQGQTFASPDGWVLSGWQNPSEPGKRMGGWSNILVRTPASGLWVMIESEGGGYKAKCLTGSKGPGACDFAGLSAGLYFIWIDGTELTLKTYMDGNAYATFDFARQ